MGEKVRLVEFSGASIDRGSIFRVCGEYPYEKSVDFMLFETQYEDRPYGLIVSSGYKAGLILVCLPKESSSQGGGVDKNWLVSNWGNWVYPDCDVSDVYLMSGYRAE